MLLATLFYCYISSNTTSSILYFIINSYTFYRIFTNLVSMLSSSTVNLP
nr:MAG TPA: hypothetical protein [Bacteriophage sp.]